MADRSDREQGQPKLSLRRHSLISRMGPCSRTPSGPAVSTDCINRPDRRLHPTNATASIYLLQRGSHPQKTQLGNRGMSEKWPISEVATRAIPRGDRLRFFRPSGCDRPNWLTWSPDHLARPVDLRMAPSPGGRHVDKHSSGRKKKSRRVPGGSSRLAVSGQPQSSVFCAAVTAAS